MCGLCDVREQACARAVQPIAFSPCPSWMHMAANWTPVDAQIRISKGLVPLVQTKLGWARNQFECMHVSHGIRWDHGCSYIISQKPTALVQNRGLFEGLYAYSINLANLKLKIDQMGLYPDTILIEPHEYEPQRMHSIKMARTERQQTNALMEAGNDPLNCINTFNE